MTMSGDRRYVGTVVAVPSLALLIGGSVVAAYWSQIPPVVASHWGSRGVDATQSKAAFLLTAIPVLVALTFVLGVAGWFTPADGRRLTAAILAGTAGFVAVLVFGVLLAQRGNPNPTEAALPSLLFFWAFLAAVGFRLSGVGGQPR
jgi:hypothetical protein